ncbi:MAG: hypothetical protein LLF75_05320 [Eubacteriales bacterium]|nr:hypothetical protein [Eubacteriales bacterium]
MIRTILIVCAYARGMISAERLAGQIAFFGGVLYGKRRIKQIQEKRVRHGRKEAFLRLVRFLALHFAFVSKLVSLILIDAVVEHGYIGSEE